jgi:hypothetical protein
MPYDFNDPQTRKLMEAPRAGSPFRLTNDDTMPGVMEPDPAATASPIGPQPQAPGGQAAPFALPQATAPLDPRAQKDAALQQYMAQSGGPGGAPQVPANTHTMTVYNGSRGNQYLYGQKPAGGVQVEAVRGLSDAGQPGASRWVSPDISGKGLEDLAGNLSLKENPPGLNDPAAEMMRQYQSGLAKGELGNAGENRKLDLEQQKNVLAWMMNQDKYSPAARLLDSEKVWMAANPNASATDLANHQRQMIDAFNATQGAYRDWMPKFPGAGNVPGIPGAAPAAAVSAPPPAYGATVQPNAVLADTERRQRIGGEIDDLIRDIPGKVQGQPGTSTDDLLTKIFRFDAAHPGYMEQHAKEVIDAIKNMRGGSAVSDFVAPASWYNPLSAFGVGAPLSGDQATRDMWQARGAWRRLLHGPQWYQRAGGLGPEAIK